MWRPLVHACRRWLRVVFESPRRLNLQLVCTAKMRGKDRLDISLLIFITHRPPPQRALYSGSINIIPAFKDDGNRMCSIDIDYPPSSQLEEINWGLAPRKLRFPICYLYHVCDRFLFHFRNYRGFFRTTTHFAFGTFLILGTFYLR